MGFLSILPISPSRVLQDSDPFGVEKVPQKVATAPLTVSKKTFLGITKQVYTSYHTNLSLYPTYVTLASLLGSVFTAKNKIFFYKRSKK